MTTTTDAPVRLVTSWIALVRWITLGCLGIHALMLIRSPDVTGAVMAAVSLWCLRHAARADADRLGRVSVGLACGGLAMVLMHLLLAHRPHHEMNTTSMDMSGHHASALLPHLGVAGATGQLLLAGMGGILCRRSAERSKEARHSR